MLLEQALYSYLSGVAGLTALVSTRIYPLMMPQDVTLPAVTYQRISGPRVHTMGTDPGLESPRFQLSSWASSYSSVKAVAEQVRLALQDYAGTMGGAGGVVVQRAFLEGDQDFYEPDTLIYQVASDFIIWAEEA